MRQIELHIFLIEVVGLPNENQSCILNILATKRLELKSIPFLTFFFQSVTDRKHSLSSPRYAICFIVTMHMQHISHMSHIYTT